MKKVYLLAVIIMIAAAFAGCNKGEQQQDGSLKETKDELILEARSNFEPIPLNVKEGYKQLKNNENMSLVKCSILNHVFQKANL